MDQKKQKEYYTKMLSIIASQDDSVKYTKDIKYRNFFPIDDDNATKIKVIWDIIFYIKTRQYEPENLSLYHKDDQYKEAYMYGLKINTIICFHNLKKVLKAYDNSLCFDFIYNELSYILYKISSTNNKYLNKGKIYKILLNSTSINQLHKIINFNLINKNNIEKVVLK